MTWLNLVERLKMMIQVGSELDTVFLLALGVATVVIAGCVLSKVSDSARSQANIWRVVLGGIVVLSVMELTGANYGLIQVLSNQFMGNWTESGETPYPTT